MNKKKKARIKDDILLLVVNDETKGSVYDIADKLDQDVRLIAYLSEELEKEELIRLIEITSLRRDIPKEYILCETIKGLYFLTFDGGHLQKYKQTRIQTIWTIVKTTAAIINAMPSWPLGYIACI